MGIMGDVATEYFARMEEFMSMSDGDRDKAMQDIARASANETYEATKDDYVPLSRHVEY